MASQNDSQLELKAAFYEKANFILKPHCHASLWKLAFALHTTFYRLVVGELEMCEVGVVEWREKANEYLEVAGEMGMGGEELKLQTTKTSHLNHLSTGEHLLQSSSYAPALPIFLSLENSLK